MVTNFVNEIKMYLVSNISLRNCKNCFIIDDCNINLLEYSINIDNSKLCLVGNGFDSFINEPTRVTGNSNTSSE